MADEAKAEGGGKKKSKLPVILVLLLVVGGGGFFMMKGKGGEKKKPEIKLGQKVELGEFLVKLSDGKTFLQTDVVVHLADGKALGEAKGGEGEKAGGTDNAPLQDAVIKILSNKSLKDVGSLPGMVALQEEIADSLNKILEAEEAAKGDDSKDKDKEKDADKDKDKAKDGDKDKAKDGDGKDKKVPREERKHPDWDSDTGPILKVYFTKFVTQS